MAHMWECRNCHANVERQYHKDAMLNGKMYALYFYKCPNCGQRVLAMYSKGKGGKLVRLTSFRANTTRTKLKDFLKSIDCWEEEDN